MPRFHCSPPLPSDGTFELPEDAAHHAARVLRLREGDKVQLFDGKGNERHGIVSRIDGKHVFIGDLAIADADRESPLSTLLAQAMVSSEKMDWVIQKATELGVTAIQPLDTQYSVAKLSADKIEKRLHHWRQVAISACEQCGRNTLPEIHAPLDIMAWLPQMQQSTMARFILHPTGANPLRAQSAPQQGAVLLVGAEGGFSDNEVIAAQQCGFTAIQMGPRILRTETAAIAGLAALQTLWGDFK